MKYLRNSLAVLMAFLALASAQLAGATDVSRQVLQTDGVAKPNVIFAMDDSGSMDFELLLDANDGAFWWNTNTQKGWTSGVPNFNPSGTADANYEKFAYLFPNGCTTVSSGETATGNPLRHLCDGSGHYALPPSLQMAWARSSDFNPLYYDPTETYLPWPTATIGGVSKTFAASSGTAAPPFPGVTTGALNLTTLLAADKTDNYVFTVVKGMDIPVGSLVETNKWSNTPTTAITTASSQQRIATPYYPATYWVRETCTTNSTSCTSVMGQSAVTIQRYEIKPGVTFPSKRSYADELQNFANWFTYYRKRKMMLASSMAQVLAELTGMRLGVVPFNVVRTSASKINMYDTDSSDATLNGKAVTGLFYGNLADGGTPTRETLKYIGDQLASNADIIQYSCQRNAAFVVTDGFAYANPTTPSAYDNGTKWGIGAPYTTRYPGTLSDIALAYYTINPRTGSPTSLPPGLPTGRVPAAIGSLDPSADKNPDLHMNTYAITLGASGTIWPAIGDPYKNTPAWPNPNVNQSQTAVDDLFHATVNGRGTMLRATNPKETARAVNDALKQILRLSGTQSGVTYSTVNLKAADSFAYLGSYKTQGWSGDIESFPVDPTNGEIGKVANWSANAMLEKKDWTKRLIATYNVTTGVAATSLSATSALNDYLRGDRSKEVATYRTRTGLMGAVIDAEPVVSTSDNVVYATSNEGMLHALDKATGEELWAYVPSFGIPDMVNQSAKGAVFQTILDGTPSISKVGTKTVLIGGRGTAGTGYYALDVTAPKASTTDADIAARVLWEFPNSSTSTADRAMLGTSVGRPLIVKTATYGTVALFTSGYNSTSDGKGRLFVLDALTGVVKATLVTADGTLAADAGLAQISGWREPAGNVQYVYAGDEQGNLWRFDLDAAASSSNPMKLAVLKGKDGKTLPVTTAPELTLNGKRRIILVGTGRLLGSADYSDVRQQAFFGIYDNNSPVADVRTDLEPRTVSFTTGTTIRKLAGNTIDWTKKRGWYVDLPAGEKANTDPALAYSVVAFTTNQPSQTACTSNSALYLTEVSTGKEVPAANFTDGVQFFGIGLASTLASRATIARSSLGKVVVTSRQSDGTTNTRLLNLKTTVPAQKTGWKEILR